MESARTHWAQTCTMEASGELKKSTVTMLQITPRMVWFHELLPASSRKYTTAPRMSNVAIPASLNTSV